MRWPKAERICPKLSRQVFCGCSTSAKSRAQLVVLTCDADDAAQMLKARESTKFRALSAAFCPADLENKLQSNLDDASGGGRINPSKGGLYTHVKTWISEVDMIEGVKGLNSELE